LNVVVEGCNLRSYDWLMFPSYLLLQPDQLRTNPGHGPHRYLHSIGLTDIVRSTQGASRPDADSFWLHVPTNQRDAGTISGWSDIVFGPIPYMQFPERRRGCKGGQAGDALSRTTDRMASRNRFPEGHLTALIRAKPRSACVWSPPQAPARTRNGVKRRPAPPRYFVLIHCSASCQHPRFRRRSSAVETTVLYGENSRVAVNDCWS
jgi:hypothetical protein